MKKSQIIIILLVLLTIVVIGLCILKVYSETLKNKDMITQNYYTKISFEEAEFLGKFERKPLHLRRVSEVSKIVYRR